MFRKSTKALISISVLALVVLLPGRLAAQSIAGNISGTVVDPSGAVIPGVEITLTNEATSETRSAVTNDTGEFVFAALQPGSYAVKAEKTGFRGFNRKGIILTASERVGLGRIQLEVGELSNTVDVTLAGEMVTTESADTAGVLSLKQLDSVPIKGRDVMNLLRTLPGVSQVAAQPWGGGEFGDTSPASSASSNGGQFGSFSPAVGGARLFWNTVTVDGQVGSNADFPGLFMAAISMDAVTEAKIVSNNYTADYGRNPGSTINLVSKSGTQDFHGNVYGYKRHEKLNANDFFNNRDGVPKPIYRFGTFGFNVSGPVFIPGKFNTDKKKLFFFYSQENWRVNLPQGLTQVTVPTEAERRGDFSQTFDQAGALRVITDPTTGLPFPSNVIPTNRINADAQRLLNIMPLPSNLNRDLTGGNYNFEWQDVCELPKMLNALKVDYNPTDKDHFSFLPRRWRADTRAYQCNALGIDGNLPIWKHHYRYITDSVVMTWTRTLSATKVNEFNSGFTGEKEQGQPEALFGRTIENYFDPIRRVNVGYQTGQLFPGANPYNIIPGVAFNFAPNGANYAPNNRLPDDQGYNRYHLTDNFSWIHGSHTMKFGVYLEMNWATDGPNADCFSGCFDFSQNVNNPGDTGWDFANALLGNFASYRETNLKQRYQGKMTNWEWFGQDTWKVNQKLTLTYGMRFTRFTPWYLSKGLGATFQPSAYNPNQVPGLFRPATGPNGERLAQDPVTGQLFPEVYIGAFSAPWDFTGSVLSSDPGYPRGFRKQQAVQPMPRFGFAYDLFGSGKTVIRGGFGTMKQTTPTYSRYIQIQNAAPVKYEPNIYYSNMNTFLSQTGLLYPTGAYAYDPNDIVPSIYRYSLGVQHELGLGTVIDVSYVGNVARHLIQNYDRNLVPYGARFQPQNQDPTSPGNALPEDFYRPVPGYNGIETTITSGSSNYNALQVAINRRYSHGVSFGVSYTWSKVMGTQASGWGGGGSIDGGPVATYRPWRVWNYGPASFDQTQMLVINYVWDLPKLSKVANNAAVRGVFDGWQLAGVSTFASGLPSPVYLNTTDGADITGGGDGARVMLIGQPQLSHGERTFQRFFNTDAFGRPPQGYYGDAPISPVRGPGLNNWDLTLMKQFRLWSEASSLQFRSEFYNAFNHPQFNSVDVGAVFDPSGAQVNSTFGQINGNRSARVIQFSLRLQF
jgi:Carboxypeptidase regulatory-like domain